jgi:hypothetical protein
MFISYKNRLFCIYETLVCEHPSGQGISGIINFLLGVYFFASYVKKSRREGLYSFDLRDAGLSDMDASGPGQLHFVQSVFVPWRIHMSRTKR